MKGQRLSWAIVVVGVAWYGGFWLRACDVLPGSWWLWCAPIYCLSALALCFRIHFWRERRRQSRSRQTRAALDAALAEALGLSGRSETQRPVLVIFYPNGLSAVADQHGRQIYALQGRHAHTVAALQAAGYDWRRLECMGAPILDFPSAPPL